MTALPWFPFWVDDFLASPKVRVMSMEEVGIYVMLLCEQHQNGVVKWPCERKANALRTDNERIAYVLQECFEEVKNGWVNPRLRMIHREQSEKSAKARKAAQARWNKASDADALPTHSGRNANQNQSQIQNQNRDAEKRTHELDDFTLAKIRGLYGWQGAEGTDPILTKASDDPSTRDRYLTIAIDRLTTEGREYQGRFFRRILEDVVKEQADDGDDLWDDVPHMNRDVINAD